MHELEHGQKVSIMIAIFILGSILAGLANDIIELILAMREALNLGLSQVFLLGGIAMLFAVALVFLLKEIPLRSTMHKQEINKVAN